MHSTKQQPSATGGRFTRLAQALALLGAVKLAAISMLWIPPSHSQTLLLQPVIVRPAMAADASAATEEAASPAEEGQTPPAADDAGQPQAEEERIQSLNEREKALDKREAELRALEAELDEKLQNLKALEIRMQKLIDSAGTIQDEKMEHLVSVYSNMKPKQAAQVLETLDEPIAVRILAGMSGRKAGEILSSVRADRAAELSEALTRLQTGND
jgi:flagellar motility protein MotE (MotC chaperone)